MAELGLPVGTLGATPLRRFAGGAVISGSATDLRLERRGGSNWWSSVAFPGDFSNFSGVRTAGFTFVGKWSPCAKSFGGDRHLTTGGVREMAAESGVRTAVRTVGDERPCAPKPFGGLRSGAGRPLASGGVRKTALAGSPPAFCGVLKNPAESGARLGAVRKSAAGSGVRTAVRTEGPVTVTLHAPEGLAGAEAPVGGLAAARVWCGLLAC